MEYAHDRSVKDESRIINAILIEPECRETVFSRLNADHFANKAGKEIFECASRCWRQNISLDTDGTFIHLTKPGDPNTDDFMAYGVPGAYNAPWEDSLEVLDRFELTRQVLKATMKSSDMAQEADKTRGDLISDLKTIWEPTLDAPVSAKTRPLVEIIESQAGLTRQTHDGTRSACTWGLVDLDSACPVFNGQMAVIAGRPGHGKTAMLTTAGMGQLKAGKGVGVISVESSSEDTLCRFYSQVNGVAYRDMIAGLKNASQETWNSYNYAQEHFRSNYSDQLFIHGGEKCGIERIKAIAMDWVKNCGVQALWLDYLTDFKLPRRKDYHLQVEAMSQAIRDLSREDKLNVPVYLLAQLNRAADDGYPRLGHLKGSSGIEQDAHVILLIDRPEVDRFAKRTYLNDKGTGARDMEKAAAIHIAKNRNGPTGIRYLAYDGPLGKFNNYSYYSDMDVDNI